MCITGLLPSSSLVSGQQWVAQEHPSYPFAEPDKGCNTQAPLHVVTHRAVTSLKPGSCISCQVPAPGQVLVFHHAAPP